MSLLFTMAWVIGLALVVVVALLWATSVQRLLRLRWRPIQSRPLDQADIPDASLQILGKVAPELRALGFTYLGSGITQSAVVTQAENPLYFQVYAHAEHHTYVMVSASPVPELRDPCLLQFITCFEDGSHWVTLNRFRHYSPIAIPGWRIFDDYLPTWQEALHRHLARVLAAPAPVQADSDDMLRDLHQSFAVLVPAMQQAGHLQADTDGPYLRLKFDSAVRFAAAALAGHWRAGRALRHLPPASPAGGTANPAPHTTADLQAFQAQWAMRHGTPATSHRTKWLVFGASALLFLAVGGWFMSWSFVPIVLAVVALHEGGHYLAMRLTGYSNVSVFFVPGLGGLAMGEKATASPLEKLAVYLAGPVPGIALAGAAFWASANGWWTAPPWLHEFLVASLIINYLNLLPLVPLDGGRVLETFLFARLPRLRFAFAALCCALLFAAGQWLGDGVLRVVAVMIAFSLPHQWRVMQLDRTTLRHTDAALGEQQAMQALFQGLQTLPRQAWSFAQRSAVVTTLMPELMGRKARPWESVAGLAVYGAVLFAPLGVAWMALPQLGANLGLLASILVPALQMPADDVEPEPARAAHPPPMVSPAAWEARLAKAATLPDAERLQLLLDAGKAANEGEDTDAASRHFRDAWVMAQHLPARDMRRIDTLEGLASVVEAETERVALLSQIVEALSDPQGDERLRVAQAKEQWSYGDMEPATQVALLRDAVQLRAGARPADDPWLLGTRMMLARALDRSKQPEEAESVLKTRIESLPLPPPEVRTREALNRRMQRIVSQVDLVWFLIAQQRHADARRTAAEALSGLPTKTTVTWVHPQQQALEAAVWAEILAPAGTDLQRLWVAYEASLQQGFGGGATTLVHEADRAVVAGALKDTVQLAQAQRGMAQARSKIGRRPAMCEDALPFATTNWRQRQQDARRQVLQASGACAS